MWVSESVVTAYQEIGSRRCGSCGCYRNESNGELILLARLKQALQHFRMECVAPGAVDVKRYRGSALSLQLEDRRREPIQGVRTDDAS